MHDILLLYYRLKITHFKNYRHGVILDEIRNLATCYGDSQYLPPIWLERDAFRRRHARRANALQRKKIRRRAIRPHWGRQKLQS